MQERSFIYKIIKIFIFQFLLKHNKCIYNLETYLPHKYFFKAFYSIHHLIDSFMNSFCYVINRYLFAKY